MRPQTYPRGVSAHSPLEAKYDKQFAVVFHVIRQLMDAPDEEGPGQIDFHTGP